MDFILDVSQIVLADIVLSGDNALIIGMAAASFAEKDRRKIIFFGLLAAAILRILFALIASYLITVPGLLLVGALLLYWVCFKFYQDIKEFSKNEGMVQVIFNDGLIYMSLKGIIDIKEEKKRLEKNVNKIDNEIKFADDPELTKTLYLTPSHFDQFFSNLSTFLDCVSIGSLFLRYLITEFRSSLLILFFING